ncbi:MAG: hypothetical protein JOZ78_01140 [Chroococcidiopsidaceae cyanobacterium CP_BM_ER_R8_30]|nr:hypothetical protein [Chroococcidiopsidaceae cyanobacterium CP_BM_ER_R8_30]
MTRHQKSQIYIFAKRIGIALALTAILYFVQCNNSFSLHSIPSSGFTKEGVTHLFSSKKW